MVSDNDLSGMKPQEQSCSPGRAADGMKPIWGYMLALLAGTIIVAAVPWISTGFLK